MSIGRIKNNPLRNTLKFILIVLTLCNCVTLGACQTKEEKVSSDLRKCQQLLDKDDLAGAFFCYGKTRLANPEADDLIVKTGEDAVFKKCLEYKDKEDFKNALICFEGAAGILPDKANVHFLLADAYYQYAQRERKRIGYYPDQELLDRAEEVVKKGLTIDPKDATAHSLYGEILKEKGKMKEAIAEYKQAVELSPKTVVFWIKLAFAQEKVNQNEEAIKSYKQALSVDSNHTGALFFWKNCTQRWDEWMMQSKLLKDDLN